MKYKEGIKQAKQEIARLESKINLSEQEKLELFVKILYGTPGANYFEPLMAHFPSLMEVYQPNE